jgi:formiminotetrahydrofolate cyclodeaminase
MCESGIKFHRKGWLTNGMSYRRETPFDNIESAEQFVELLIEAIEESRRDVDAEIALAEANRLVRSKKALQLVSANLAKLSQYMTTSRRILNRLRTLRRLLLQERRLDNAPQTRNGNRELNRWS